MKMESEDNLNDEVVAAMRRIYAAPTDAGYWDSLAARITAASRSATPGRDAAWYSVLAGWAAPGLAAAALLLGVAGALWSLMDQAEQRVTYEGFTQPMVADAMPGAAELLDLPRDGSSQREATLGYVLSH